MESQQNIEPLIKSSRGFASDCSDLEFSKKVAAVYNPLGYAWKPYETYLRRFGGTPKKALFFGMNPGPWGMAQTGVPFGEITTVRDWLGIREKVGKPEQELPDRPIQGFECTRSEVSGRRVWGLMKDRFLTAENFFKDHFIANYCPLIFFEARGKNLTPDKLVKEDREKIFKLCDEHVRILIDFFEPAYLVGFGKFAESRLAQIVEDARQDLAVVGVLHPSPANPRANRGWEDQAAAALVSSGVWT